MEPPEEEERPYEKQRRALEAASEDIRVFVEGLGAGVVLGARDCGEGLRTGAESSSGSDDEGRRGWIGEERGEEGSSRGVNPKP